jgi:hypothetical protein
LWFLLLEEFSKDLCFFRGRLGDRDGDPIHVTHDVQGLGGGSGEVPRGVTTAAGPHFVKPEERIAVFDNDGTLWSEQPFYFQFAFVLESRDTCANLNSSF